MAARSPAVPSGVAVPEVVASVVNVGATGWRADAGAEGEIRLSLVPAKERKRSNVEIAKDLQRRLEANVPESLTVLRLPPSHRRRLRTTNMLERLNREIKRRTRVATLFPNEASLLRLVTAILIEISEDWETGKRYVTF